MKHTAGFCLTLALVVLLSATVVASYEFANTKTTAAISEVPSQNQPTPNKANDLDNPGEGNQVFQEMTEQRLIHQNNDYNVLLKARHFIPTKGISTALKARLNKIAAAGPTEKMHVLLQFERIPTVQEREELKREGIDLLAYVPNNAWYVSLPAGRADQVAAKPLVRTIDVIEPEYKISPYIQEGKIGDWAIDENGDII